MSERTPDDFLVALQAAVLDDLEQVSDEELLKEAVEDGEDPSADLAALKQEMERKAAQLQCHNVVNIEWHRHPPREADAVRRRALPAGGKGTQQAPLDSVLEEEEQALAANILMKLYASSKARCRSDLPFDCAAESPAHRDMRSELMIKKLLLQLVERWILLRMDESEELADLLVESRAQILRPLLRNAIQDSQILKFASISLGTLVSTLCTSVLAKASGLDVDSQRRSGERDQRRRQIRARAEWRAFHALIDHEPRLVTDWVDPTRAISALATMQRALAEYNPDAIVAVAGGGEIIGEFLCNKIGMDAGRYFVARRANGKYGLEGAFPRCGSIKRVVIIDDISRTGRTLTSVRDEIFGGMDGIEFKALALVSAAVAINRIRDFFLFLPIVSQSSNVSVPWDTKGSYWTKKDSYVFGRHRGVRMEVPKRLYEQTYGEVGT